jgi:hypothetical protein
LKWAAEFSTFLFACSNANMMPENKIKPGIFSFFEWKQYPRRVSKGQDKQKGNSVCLSGACVVMF